MNSKVYITGDTHGDFRRIFDFCIRNNTTKNDILIILGDAAVNYGGLRDMQRKEYIQEMPITLFCIHGNHEQRPQTIPTYKEEVWHGGIVYVEPQFPDIIFAKDGEIYDINGKKTVVIGGAYSVDKMYRVAYGFNWWADEQPSEEVKQYVEEQLNANNWNVDIVLSHTVPLKYEPVEVFLSGIDQSTVDKSTEIWLGKIEERLQYGKWYAGHYHTEKKIDKLELMFENYTCL